MSELQRMSSLVFLGRKLFFYPNDPEGLAKIIVDDLSASLWCASANYLGSHAFCRPSCIQRGDHVSERCAFRAAGFK